MIGSNYLLLMVIGSPREVTLQLNQYHKLHQQTMGTEDEHRAIPTEDREVLEDLGEGTCPRGLLPTTYKHHPMSLVRDVEVLMFSGIVLRGRPTIGTRGHHLGTNMISCLFVLGGLKLKN